MSDDLVPVTPELVPVDGQVDTVLGPDGIWYELDARGEAEVEQGPLGRFVALAEAIRGEGGEVPVEIQQALDGLTAPR